MYLVVLAGGFPRVLFLFPPLWCFPPAVSGWGSVWVGLTPHDDLASTGFHDCHQRTVRQPRPTRPRLATGARPSVPHHHPVLPRRARTTSRPTSISRIATEKALISILDEACALFRTERCIHRRVTIQRDTSTHAEGTTDLHTYMHTYRVNPLALRLRIHLCIYALAP